MALTPGHEPPGLPAPRALLADLFSAKGLAWSGRGWLFFGHRFSDWLPRLQLLFTALMLGQDARGFSPQTGWANTPAALSNRDRIAVSRRFDWPEQALLDALEVHKHALDLGAVSHYFEAQTSHHGSPLASSQAIVRFLEHVKAIVGVPSIVGVPRPPLGASEAAPRAEAVRGQGPAPKVFISYSQERNTPDSEEWQAMVREFAALLRKSEIDAEIDQYGPRLGRDWGTYGSQAIEQAEIIVCLASPGYLISWEASARRGRSEGGASADLGAGAIHEARTIRNLMSEKYVVFVVLPGRSASDIPRSMQGDEYAVVPSIDDDGIRGAVDLLTGQPRTPKPPLGGIDPPE